jgi:hypothetical protein
MGRAPDFSIRTRNLLAKRSGNMCSNPDCRKITSASSKNTNKAIDIGEAAHISGAKKGSARYDPTITDRSRALIVNAIWLCRACHKMIDDDPLRFTSSLIFRWRELHDDFTVELMQSKTESIRRELEILEFEAFDDFPPRVRRILIDKPSFWEGELTQELLKYLLSPLIREHADLARGAYVPDTRVVETGKEGAFIQRKLAEATRIIQTIGVIYTQDLVTSWGVSGVPGDADEILRACKLIKRAVRQMVDWEAELKGVFLEDEDYIEVFRVLEGAVAHQLVQVLGVNSLVSEVIDSVRKLKDGEKLNIDHTMVFDLPEGFSDRFDAALALVMSKKGVV